MSTRLNQPKTGATVIVVMQRLHEGDLTGHLVEQGVEHLCLPAEYEPSHPFGWPQDPRVEEGELLWPERIDSESLGQLKRALGSYGAAGQLQQRPAPAEGEILKGRWWRWWSGRPEEAPHFERIIQSWDVQAVRDLTAWVEENYPVSTRIGSGNTVRDFRDEVLDALTAAYREAVAGRVD